MDPEVYAALRALAASLPDVVVRPCWGEEGFFHHPPGCPKRHGTMFLSVRRDPRARYSVAVPTALYEAWFGARPARLRRREPRARSKLRHGPFVPHPQYAWNGWVAVENPAVSDVEAVAWAIREAYSRAVGGE